MALASCVQEVSMAIFNQLKIRTKLLGSFLIVSLLPVGLITLIALNKASRALNDEAVAKFTAVQQTKRHHLEDYFQRVRTAAIITKDDPFLEQCLTAFNNAYAEGGNSVDSDEWRIIVEFKEPRLKGIVADNGFHDLLLISNEGNVVYSVVKAADLGQNLAESELAGSSLGRAFRRMADASGNNAGEDAVVISDFAAYTPSNGEQAAFMMARMKSQLGEAVGYVAIHITVDQINAIVQQRSGMGETGESYLVGRADGRIGLRSDQVVRSGKIGDPAAGPYIELALRGESGAAIDTDADGNREFVRYDPIHIGGLNWALITTADTQEVFAAVGTLRNTILLVILAVVVAVFGLALLVTAVIVKPIKGTATMLKDIAEGEGDLTKRLAVHTRDEIGEMATWFNSFMEKLQEIIGQITQDATTLNDSAASLSTAAGQMTSGVEGISKRSAQVSTASKEMSKNMAAVATASEQTATNMNMVATATEEMTATVNEIAQNSGKAKSITESAVSKTGQASTKVEELGHAADEISKVTEVINEISEQTNLLALNATIEAARAGEAGKGFAVVANEIKELAKQTASATFEIKNRIDGIQGSTADTVTQIGEISGVISEVSEIVATIAASVEEQAATSQEIADNVGQASQGIQEMNTNVNQSSTVAGSISDDIGEVSTAVYGIADSSGLVNTKSDELSALADKLHDLVDRFKI
jgi:methyl-accepting chemotaxis protein